MSLFPSIRLLVSLTLCGALSGNANSQGVSNLPQSGTYAPAFYVTQVGKQDDGQRIDLSSFRGRVVVIEFWATWCAPCLGEIPKINALARSLQGDRVVFLSVTDEDPSVVRAFMAHHQMAGIVAVDQADTIYERYGVNARPATIVIGPQGKIASNDLRPDQLTPTQLESLSRRGSGALKVPPRDTHPGRGEPSDDSSNARHFPGIGKPDQVLASIVLAPGRAGAPHLSVHGRNFYELYSAPIKQLISYALGFSEQRITLDDAVVDGRKFDLSVQANAASEASVKHAVEAAIETATGAVIEHHSQEEDVWLIKTSNDHVAKAAQRSDAGGVAGFDSKRQQIVMLNASGEQIAFASEQALAMPVVNEMPGGFVCTGTIAVKERVSESLLSGLADQCGIALQSGKHSVVRINIASEKP